MFLSFGGLVCLFGSHPTILGLLLAVLGGPCWVLGIEPESGGQGKHPTCCTVSPAPLDGNWGHAFLSDASSVSRPFPVDPCLTLFCVGVCSTAVDTGLPVCAPIRDFRAVVALSCLCFLMRFHSGPGPPHRPHVVVW